ncbi:hypothetical protein M413DRAFT_444096 [Hebeloma cylindrosporum]|uniref:Peptidase A1 domain-containing protein n=1 Tax=Hebeloma cylindrosporum TaxID=76867 RepID=A0A0C3C2Z7_HEBCY|nr:hypothetical protein M413DRAFT_444096 [Hebeloma cylindrosporum h7]
MRSLIPLSLLLTIFDPAVNALKFPFEVRFPHPTPSSSLNRRSPLPVRNIGNAQYVSNITLAGQTLPVLLDTGSSDLWAHFANTIPTAMTDTGTSVTLSYAVGKAAGNVQTAAVTLGNQTIPDQVFLWVNDTTTFTGDIHAQGYDGLLGLGPNDSSVIRKKLKKASSANTLLQRIFDANKASDNYISILLSRKRNSTDLSTGQFTISEIVPGMENITSMPKLDVDKVNRLLKADQHWQALTDKNIGIIGPDGQPVQIDSIVPNAPKGQFVAVVDSGFTFSQVPRDVSDALYGRVSGAFYDTKNEWWLVPCGQYLNISFNFGGRNYPIHPLDTVDDNFNKLDSSGKKVCIGAFQPITSAFSILGHYDMILGMSFLRSAYTLLNFGNWIKDSTNQGTPYIQMSSLVDVAAARNEFIQTRLGGVDTISDAKWALLPADQMQHSPISPDEKKKKYQEMVLSRWPYILLGCLVFVILVIGLIVWKCCCRRKKKESDMGLATGGKKGLFSGKGKRDSYVPLEAQNRSVADLNAPYAANGGDSIRSSVPLPPYTSHQYETGRQSFQSQYSGHNQGHHSQYDVGHQGGHNPQYPDYGNGNRGYQGHYQA